MLSLLALLATAATARVMDKVPSVPKGWSELRQASPEELITLRVALPQQHAAELEEAVVDMSTPGSENYGKHMSRLELRAYTAPSAQSVSSVVGWLAESNITASVNNDWITFTTDVATANELLDTTFAWYQYGAGGSPKLRTLSYSVPDEMAQNIDLIQPTTRFGQLGAQKSTIFDMQILEPVEEVTESNVDTTAATCNVNQITPECIKSLYNIKYTASPEGNLVAFSSYLEEYARYTDLQSFESKWLPAAAGQNFTVELVNGGLDDQDSNDDSGMFCSLIEGRFDLILTMNRGSKPGRSVHPGCRRASPDPRIQHRWKRVRNSTQEQTQCI